LYALQVIERGEDIIEYVGEGIDLSKEKTTIFQYLMHLQSTYYIDAKRKGNLSRFINHSCNPNSEVKKVIVSFSLLLVVCCMSF
jgi:histone-lysine N-methyltransferase SETD2